MPPTPPPTLKFSTIRSEHLEPLAEPEVVLPPAPAFSISQIRFEHVEPLAEPEVVLPPAPAFSISQIRFEHVEPLAEPEPPVPEPAALSYSAINVQHVEPLAEPEPPAPVLAPLLFSTIETQHVEPVAEPKALLPAFAISPIVSQHITPVSPPEPEPVVNPLGFSIIQSVNTEPVEVRSSKRNAFILPRDGEAEKELPRTPTQSLDGILSWGKGKGKSAASPVIAEDETRQSPSDSPLSETPESQRPFKEISTNANVKPVRREKIPTSDQSAQTSLTADVIDQLMRAGTSRPAVGGHQKSDSFTGSLPNMDTPGTVHIRRSQDSMNSVIRSKGADTGSAAIRRPGSAASGRTSLQPLVPPLPPNHREVIEAARSGSAHGGQEVGGSMVPPLFPASAMKNQQLRPRTPNSLRPMSPASGRGTPTPRAARFGSAHGTAEPYSPHLSAISRQSSVSSFASEVDARFNIGSDMGMDSTGFGRNTDPRMIQAITQTMIGEYLWKYTRKTGRGEMSENRHRRYFWVHPYTRTLHWSDRDPSTAGRAELKAKSVPIEAVRVVTDDNPMPPGLHRKSLVVISPGRTIKLTCTTGQRHETWFNALSYLLLRTNNEQQHQADTEEMGGNITREDVDEFNPPYGRRSAASTRPRPPPSLLSYNSRTTRDESPAIGMSMNIPTLTPTPKKPAPPVSAGRHSSGTLGRISGYWRASQLGSLASRRSRSAMGREGVVHGGIYEASDVHDSAEDLRMIYEQQAREADRLENVRACCDGEHTPSSNPKYE